jgi:cytoskeletal protein CcmA (bactofilin family)
MKITDIIGATGPSATSPSLSSKDTVVGANSQFTGNIMFTQKLRISGTVKGNIESNDDSDAEVTIHNSGVVEGDVNAPTIILKGEVNGNVHSSNKIVIDASALVTGNVYYDILEMHGGATVNGSLIRNMGKTAGLIEKKVEKDNTNSSFLQSIDNKKEK